ncbi:MAG TPA: ArsA-related P-loop ATPase [Actinomycetota bacterium]|jgi:anion-transporting  ArsA/GET3 family ATPase
MPASGPFDRRLLIVSGKGGTGKTTVAAACAVAAARGGRRVLLVEVEGRGGAFELLRLPNPGFEERRTKLGFSVLAVTAREALLEYLWLFFHMGALSRTLARAQVVETVTDGVPGFRDLMVAGKMYELTSWRRSSREAEARRRVHYDLVVVDAPPTGQVLGMLRAPDTYRGIIRGGRPSRQLVAIDRLFRQESAIALVTTPEDLPVDETIETIEALGGAGFPDPWIVANRVRPPAFPRGTKAAGMRLDPDGLAALLRDAGAPLPDDGTGRLLAAAREEETSVEAERRLLRRLPRRPDVQLPLLATPSFGRPEVEVLAGELAGRLGTAS